MAVTNALAVPAQPSLLAACRAAPPHPARTLSPIPPFSPLPLRPIGCRVISLSGRSFANRAPCGSCSPLLNKIQNLEFGWSALESGVEAVHSKNDQGNDYVSTRRAVIGFTLGLYGFSMAMLNAYGAGLPPEQKPRLCDDACEKDLENVPMVTTESGLKFKDIKVGEGPSPPIGFQVAANYVAMVQSGQIFDSSLERGQPYIFRVGSGQVVKGLDEGILSMRVGGKRRIYVPGSLAFPKGLASAPGRPRVAPNSPVIFDVSLEYIPGLDDE